ncbi:nucleotidyltransferase domain-containing protein [candidate division KSB1 bacterium]|nr:nucleotidyltransferase domain-containing protein [candidate division KSB1 bacterium]
MIAYNEIKKYPQEISDELIKAVNILRNEGAKKVILFGSLAKKKFRDQSDIDLACEGLEDRRFFNVFGKLLLHIKKPLDLIDINDANEFFANRVKEEGIILYEE